MFRRLLPFNIIAFSLSSTFNPFPCPRANNGNNFKCNFKWQPRKRFNFFCVHSFLFSESTFDIVKRKSFQLSMSVCLNVCLQVSIINSVSIGSLKLCSNINWTTTFNRQVGVFHVFHFLEEILIFWKAPAIEFSLCSGH